MTTLSHLVSYLRPGSGINIGPCAQEIVAGLSASALQFEIDACVISWRDATPITGDEAAAALPAFLSSVAAVDASQRQAAIAAKRYEIETGGIAVNGIIIPTDRDTQMKMMAARIRAKEDAAYTVNWKTPAGFVPLNSNSVIAIADAMAAHVQACFDHEAALLDDPAMDINSGWPS
jgi:hypothetical protein